MAFGTQVHEMLEAGGPDKSLFVEIPTEVLNDDGHKKGKAWTEFAKAHPGAFFFKKGERCSMVEIWENVNKNKIGKHLVEQERKEVELYWTDEATGIECRAKLDVDSDAPYQCIADWKTTRSIEKRSFKSDCCRMNYAERLAFYRRGMAAKTGLWLPVIAFAIESEGSHRVQPFQFSEDWLVAADERLSEVLEEMAAFDIEKEMNKEKVVLEIPYWLQTEQELVGFDG